MRLGHRNGIRGLAGLLRWLILPAVTVLLLGAVAPAGAKVHRHRAKVHRHHQPRVQHGGANASAGTSDGAIARAGNFPGPVFFARGFVDDPLFYSSPAPIQNQWLGTAQSLGSSMIRIGILWARIAPTTRPPGFQAANPASPAYDFSWLDTAIIDAAAHGQSVLLAVRDAPLWAEGTNPPPPTNAGLFPGVWFPNAGDLGQFAQALAARYSGHFTNSVGIVLPRVRFFQAWNEPNITRYLMPQWTGTGKPVSPTVYRSMLNAFYAGVKSVDPSDSVIAAGLAPYGNAPLTGRGDMTPVTFLTNLFCLTPSLTPLNPCPTPPHLDGLDHHPYAGSPLFHARNPLDIAIPDLGKIWRILHSAMQFHRVLPRGPKPLWITETDWSTAPPGSLAEQAHNLPLTFYELWTEGVTRVMWFEIQDPPGQPNSFGSAGLFTPDGSPKPAVANYRFPFVALPAPNRHVTIWGQAPGPGTVIIQKLTRGGWQRLLRLHATSSGIFYARARVSATNTFRALSGGLTSPVWSNP